MDTKTEIQYEQFSENKEKYMPSDGSNNIKQSRLDS